MKIPAVAAVFLLISVVGCIQPKTTQKNAILVIDRSCQNLWADRCEVRNGKAKCTGLHLVPKCSRVEQ